MEFIIDNTTRVPAVLSEGSYSAEIDTSGYEHGSTHTVAAQAFDTSQNASDVSPSPARSFTIDRQVSLTLEDMPAPDGFVNILPASLSFTTDPDVVKRECRVNQDAFAACSSPFEPALNGDGGYTYEVRVTDDVGNTASAQRNFTLDRTLPTLTITAGPGDQVFGPNTTQAWTFRAEDALNGLPDVGCSVVPSGAEANYGPCKTATSHSVSNKPDGSYEFRIRATDDAGKRRELARTFGIDATPPGVRIDSGLAHFARTNQSSVTWTFSAAEAGAKFECRSYPGALFPRPEFGPCLGNGQHTVDRLSAGNYVFEVRARDAFGNVDGRPLIRDFTVDTTAPRVLKVSPAANARKVDPAANVSATFSEGMLSSTINRLNFKLIRAGASSPTGAKVTLNRTTNVATLNPKKFLVRGATYRAVVTAGTRDLAGNRLAVGRSWSFKVK